MLRSCMPSAYSSLTAMQTVARLSAMTRLRLASFGAHVSNIPGCEELACLRGSSLEDLVLSLHQVPEAMAWAASHVGHHFVLAHLFRSGL